MSDIKVLENSMINKIAAGEVVERPLSVVKELVENSIDAGAGDITVEIKDGGTTYIRVTDNGKGIPKEQVKTAFMRHATSKISNMDDLENVLSLGFRGEALSSIASVAQLELVTKTINDITGTRLVLNGGEIEFESEIGCTDGTSFLIKNLFYNVPARRKFLKKPATESGYISDMMNKLALANPDIAFKYINNNTNLLQTKGNGDLKTVIFQIYGKDVTNKLLEIEYNKKPIKLSGFVGKPEVGRSNRSYSLFFINGRYVKSELIQTAAEEAFKGRLTVGKFPLFVLNMEIAPNLVDVNVHPTKLEVRFSDEDSVRDAVYEAITKALKSAILIPNTKTEERPKFSVSERYATRPFTFAESYGDVEVPIEKKPMPNPAQPVLAEKTEPKHEAKLEIKSETKPEIVRFFNDYKIVGQVFNTYWIVEQLGSVYFIDQHAAHERVLYENLLNKLREGNLHSQKLIQPLIVPVSQIEKQLLKQNLGMFEDFGFELEEFDQNSYALYAVPFVFKSPAGAGFFLEILDSLGRMDKNIENIYEAKLDAVASMSCKAAVKANDRLSYGEARGLIEQVLKLENPFTCPHGRPTIIEMSQYDIEKKFKRV